MPASRRAVRASRSTKKPHWRLPVWRETDAGSANPRFAVATTAGKDVWVWLESEDDSHQSGWLEFGPLPTMTPDAIAGLVYLEDPLTPLLVAIQGQNLWVRLWSAAPSPALPWLFNATSDPASRNAQSAGSNSRRGATRDDHRKRSRWRGGRQRAVYRPTRRHVYSTGPTDADFDVEPVAVLNAPNDRVIAYAQTLLNAIVMVREGEPDVTIQLKETDAKVMGLEVFLDAGDSLQFLASVVHSSGSYTLAWAPTTLGAATDLVAHRNPDCDGREPRRRPDDVRRTGRDSRRQGDLLAAPFDVTASVQETAVPILGGIVLAVVGAGTPAERSSGPRRRRRRGCAPSPITGRRRAERSSTQLPAPFRPP